MLPPQKSKPFPFHTLTQNFTSHFASRVAFSACSCRAGWRGACIDACIWIADRCSCNAIFLPLSTLQSEAAHCHEHNYSAGLGQDCVGLDLQLALYLDPRSPASLPASIQVCACALHVTRSRRVTFPCRLSSTWRIPLNFHSIARTFLKRPEIKLLSKVRHEYAVQHPQKSHVF